MKNTIRNLVLSLLFVCSAAQAASHGSNPSNSGFTFNYNVGSTVTNYHAYALAIQIGFPQPANTVPFLNWYVWDLGPVSGSGSVFCPSQIPVKGTAQENKGFLFFADASDTGGQDNIHPVAEATEYVPRVMNGDYIVDIIYSRSSGLILYDGPPFSPFAWDFSAYLW